MKEENIMTSFEILFIHCQEKRLYNFAGHRELQVKLHVKVILVNL